MDLHHEVPADLSPGLGIHAFRSLMLTVLVGLLAACGRCEQADQNGQHQPPETVHAQAPVPIPLSEPTTQAHYSISAFWS